MLRVVGTRVIVPSSTSFLCMTLLCSFSCRSAAVWASLLLLWAGAPGLTPVLGQSSPDTDRRPTVTVAVALDDSSRATRQQADAMLNGLRRLVRSTHRIRRPDQWSRVVDSGESGAVILDSLLEADVQLVLGVGPRTAHRLGTRTDRPVPSVVAPILDAEMQGLPETPAARTDANLAYVSTPDLFKENVRLLRSLTEVSRPSLLVPESLLAVDDGLADRIRRTLAARADSGATWSLVPVQEQSDSTLSALPTETDAAYLLAPGTLPVTERDRLLAGLNARQIPAVVHRGRSAVERGALATHYAPSPSPIPRRAALHAAELLRGTPPGSLDVGFSARGAPVLNVETAQQLGLPLPTDLRLDATLVGEKTAHSADSLTFAAAVQRGVRANNDLKAIRAETEARSRDVQIERADFLPQVQARGQALTVTEEQAAASFGAQPERSASGELSVSQTLYSPRDHAELSAAKQRRAANAADLNTSRKDVALRAAEAYVGVLHARSVAETRRANLSLARETLSLTRSQRQAGQVGQQAVLRFRTQAAQARQALLTARSRVRVARTRLKQVLARPLDDVLRLQSVSLRDSTLTLTEDLFARYAHSPDTRSRLRHVLAREGVSNAPALRALDAQIAAAERGLQGARRSYWVPDLSLQGSLNSRLLEGGAGTEAISLPNIPRDIPQSPSTTWNVGLTLSLPLFTGLRRDGTVSQAQAQVRQLRARRQEVKTRLEERIRSRTDQAAAGYLGLREAEAATRTAEESLSLVQKSYTSGAATVLDLIDAQEAVLNARLSEANTRYDFLRRLIQTERSISSLGPLHSASERAALRERLRAAMDAE